MKQGSRHQHRRVKALVMHQWLIYNNMVKLRDVLQQQVYETHQKLPFEKIGQYLRHPLRQQPKPFHQH